MKHILIKPHITEKTTEDTKKSKFTFSVSKNARKEEIKKTVEHLFKVNVISVNVSKNESEVKRNMKFGNYRVKGGVKKAIITLKKGQKIDLFNIESKE